MDSEEVTSDRYTQTWPCFKRLTPRGEILIVDVADPVGGIRTWYCLRTGEREDEHRVSQVK